MKMQIVHRSQNILVSCTGHYDTDVIEAFVGRETQESGWRLCSKWVITLGEYSYLQDNPHINSEGKWMYLLERI